jgi:hypothetical protein
VEFHLWQYIVEMFLLMKHVWANKTMKSAKGRQLLISKLSAFLGDAFPTSRNPLMEQNSSKNEEACSKITDLLQYSLSTSRTKKVEYRLTLQLRTMSMSWNLHEH